ncbi:MAG TPA: GNAT family N-acetyltransferase [Patescibacteria group bacterium]|nr:GNAT family N-acetyltransferase [Patescibacteria group bacterium]
MITLIKKTILYGRLGDWKYGIWTEEKYFPNFMRKNAHLWLNNFEELVGYVISENCDSSFSIFAKRGYEFLYPEMIKWVKINWSSREGNLTTEVHEHQNSYIQELEEEGFKQTELCCITRQYNLHDKAQEPVSIGAEFTIQDALVNPDLKRKSSLYNNAWGNKSTVDNLDLLKYEYNRENPCYYPKLDLSVVDKNGLHASSCVAFVDYKNNYAEIEKVCAHSDYRGLGLAEAVIRECFKRLNNEGILHAYITGYSTQALNLYEKLGAVKSKNWYSYTLPKE